ncbi:hypothetical protein RRG08_041061 [Elysia crispata]|uniref:Secreted protein n=1 Tax=Elysia crispata TaxID=231223 RepID=A0AAE0Y842_9GAST|nr:hypothetical protein RRG08_041061 [Elysia crispata]
MAPHQWLCLAVITPLSNGTWRSTTLFNGNVVGRPTVCVQNMTWDECRIRFEPQSRKQGYVCVRECEYREMVVVDTRAESVNDS